MVYQISQIFRNFKTVKHQFINTVLSVAASLGKPSATQAPQAIAGPSFYTISKPLLTKCPYRSIWTIKKNGLLGFTHNTFGLRFAALSFQKSKAING